MEAIIIIVAADVVLAQFDLLNKQQGTHMFALSAPLPQNRHSHYLSISIAWRTDVRTRRYNNVGAIQRLKSQMRHDTRLEEVLPMAR